MTPPLMRSLLIAALVGMKSYPATAHAFPESADPPVGGTVTIPPTVVTITFTEALEPHFSSLSVEDSTGDAVDLGDFHVAAGNAAQFTVGLKPLKPGTYKVLWRVTSVDTHKTNGTYTFTVAP